jgi:hypothetical protein
MSDRDQLAKQWEADEHQLMARQMRIFVIALAALAIAVILLNSGGGPVDADFWPF